MSLRPEEISAVIRREIAGYESRASMDEVGTILEVGDGIARIYGLENAMAGELLEFPGGIMGMALNLEEDNVGAVLLGNDTKIKEGDIVKRTGRVAEVLGRRRPDRPCRPMRWASRLTERARF